jgi:AcrR family transcriptional regulator
MAREKNKEVEIIKAGSMVFCKKGFSNASIQEIADCADIGKGTIYEYFKSKEELFILVMEYNHNEYVKRLEEYLLGIHTFEKKLEAFFLYNQEVIEKNLEHIELMIKNEFSALSSRAKDKIQSLMQILRRKVVAIIVEILKLGEKEGKVRSLNQEFIGDIFFEMVMRTCTRFVQKAVSEQEKEREKKDLFEFFLKGIQGG